MHAFMRGVGVHVGSDLGRGHRGLLVAQGLDVHLVQISVLLGIFSVAGRDQGLRHLEVVGGGSSMLVRFIVDIGSGVGNIPLKTVGELVNTGTTFKFFAISWRGYNVSIPLIHTPKIDPS